MDSTRTGPPGQMFALDGSVHADARDLPLACAPEQLPLLRACRRPRHILTQGGKRACLRIAGVARRLFVAFRPSQTSRNGRNARHSLTDCSFHATAIANKLAGHGCGVGRCNASTKNKVPASQYWLVPAGKAGCDDALANSVRLPRTRERVAM